MKLKNLYIDSYLKVGSEGLEEPGAIRWNNVNLQTYKDGIGWINIDETEYDGNDVTLKLKRYTKNDWEVNNPILEQGEIGIILPDVTNDKVDFKVGDGLSKWNDLDPYFKQLAKDQITELHNVGFNRPGDSNFALSVNGEMYTNDTINIDLTKSGSSITGLRINANDNTVKIWEVSKFKDSKTYGFYKEYHGQNHDKYNSLRTYSHNNNNPMLIDELLQDGTKIHHKKDIWKDSTQLSFGDNDNLTLYYDGTDSHIESNYGNLYIDTTSIHNSIIFRGNDKQAVTRDMFKINPLLGFDFTYEDKELLKLRKDLINFYTEIRTPELQFNKNEINSISNDTDNYDLRLNYNGFDGSYERYRDTNIYNGKQEVIFSVKGESKTVKINGILDMDEAPIRFRELISTHGYTIADNNESSIDFISDDEEFNNINLLTRTGLKGSIYNDINTFGLKNEYGKEFIYFNNISSLPDSTVQGITVADSDFMITGEASGEVYSSGYNGIGWKLTKTGSVVNPVHTLTVDKLVVRENIRNYDDEIQKARNIQGEVWLGEKLVSSKIEMI